MGCEAQLRQVGQANCYREANSAEANEGVEATYMEADGVVPD